MSERRQGMTREHYSEVGSDWDYFAHNQARYRAYKLGEDGLGGLCNHKQWLCFALALRNERFPPAFVTRICAAL